MSVKNNTVTVTFKSKDSAQGVAVHVYHTIKNIVSLQNI